MSLQKKIMLALILGISLYGGIYLYALNSEAFRFIKEALESSPAIAQRVGRGPKVTLPLFGAFKEKHVNSSETVTIKVTVVGSIESIPVDVRAIRKEGIWKIESASTDGVPVDLNQYGYVSGSPLRWTDVAGLRTVPEGRFPGVGELLKQAKEIACKVRAVASNAIAESQERAKIVWEANNRAIGEAYERAVESCLLKSSSGSSGNSCSSTNSDYQACMDDANAARRKAEDDNWNWYSSNFSRPPTPAERGVNVTEPFCD